MREKQTKKNVKATVEYKRALARAIIEFLNFPAPKVHSITTDDMRRRDGSPNVFWAREGVK
jgi:hypothetical protein